MNTETYSQQRLRIHRSVERLCTTQITRILHSGSGDTFEYPPDELRARHRRMRLGPALLNCEYALGNVREEWKR